MTRAGGLLLLAVSCGPSREAAPTGSPHAVHDPAFRFCHVPGADADDVRAWCDLLDEGAAERCPGFEATCRTGGESAGAPPPASGCGPSNPEQVASEPIPPPPPPTSCEALQGGGWELLLRWVAAIAVAVLVFAIARAIWYTLGRRSRRVVPAAPRVEGPAADELPDVPDLPSADLLAEARRALREGRLGEAVVLARGAALRQLGEARRLRLHRSRTDREYVRALRGDASAQQDLRLVVAAVEQHRWGGDPLAPSVAEAALAAVGRLLAVAGPVMLGSLLLLGAAPASAQTRHTPYGDAALRHALELRGHDAGWRLTDLADIDDEIDAMFLETTTLEPTSDQWEAVRSWVERGSVLVLAGAPERGQAWSAFPELGPYRSLDVPAATLRAPVLEGTGLPAPLWAGGVEAVYDGGEAWVLALSEGGEVVGRAVTVANVGLGVVVGIADPRLLWNASFVRPGNEAFIGDLLQVGQGIEGWPVPTPARVQLATSAAISTSAANPLGAVANARLGLFVVQFLLTWALLGL